jgi:MerR family transcriptional regulator, heat shock protein HspR
MAAEARGPAPPRPRGVYVISVAAELAGVHPQTLRIYERKGLLDPARTVGGNRRYSEGDIDRLRRIAELTSDGLNLAGVKRVLELEEQLHSLRDSLEQVRRDARDAVDEVSRRHRRDLVPVSQSMVVWGRRPSIFDEGS